MNHKIYEEETPEEYGDVLEAREAVTEDGEDEQYRSPMEYYFGNTDPYLKPTFQPTDRPHKNYWIDEEGNLHTRNLAAYWLPEFRIEKEIGGTVYTVTGSYEGTETLHKKLERIMARHVSEKFTENTEDEQ